MANGKPMIEIQYREIKLGTCSPIDIKTERFSLTQVQNIFNIFDAGRIYQARCRVVFPPSLCRRKWSEWSEAFCFPVTPESK